MIESTLGWALLSREALRRAEEHLREDEQGVRDEIGFLALHQAYANRFFPGTSVLQTRIKYVLFVPWIYDRVAQRSDRRQASRIVQQEEVDLARRLRATYGASGGVIGARSYPRPTSQPPSMVYWTALTAWGTLHPMTDGSYPSRATVHRRLSRTQVSSRLQDDDQQPLEEGFSLFIAVPSPPKQWQNKGEPLTFDLTEQEDRFIRRQLVGVNRPGRLSGPCLLARMAECRTSIAGLESPWMDEILQIADEDDREALLRAQQAASLAAIGRAVYAALVEHICDKEDKRPMPERHRLHLEYAIRAHGSEAVKLDFGGVEQDAPGPLPQRILNVLSETQRWLQRRGDYLDLRALYEQAEVRRKGRRACLARTLAGRERRAGWDTETSPHVKAEPLHYRWENVKRLLADL